MIKGVDLSHFNGAVDLKGLMNEGVAFAYLKALEGVTYADATFRARIQACLSLRLPWGPYHFYRPRHDAMSQADAFLGTIGNLPAGCLAPALDLEYCPVIGGDGDQWDAQDPVAVCTNIGAWFFEVEKSLGLPENSCPIYTTKSWWETYTRDSRSFNARPLWVAHYDKTPPELFGGWTSWAFWQQEAVAGIDRDLFNGDILPLTK